MILAIDAGNSRVKWGWLETANDGGVAHDGYSWTNIATVSLIEFAASMWNMKGLQLAPRSASELGLY